MDLRSWIAVFGTMLGAFMAVLDIQITNSSLRDIAGGIAATPDEGSWISTAYLVGEIITIPLTAWFAEVFTVRYYLLANIVLFLIFSALCGISTSLGEMIIFRAGQGFTGGVFIPMALTVIIRRMPKNLLPIGQAMFGMTATLAPAIGPALGGWLTDRFGWEWNFYVNFIPGALMFASIFYATSKRSMKLEQLRDGDWWGILCMAIGLGSLIAMLEEGQRKDWFGSPFIRNCAILAAIFVPLFIIIELVREKPFVNLRLLGCRNLGFSSIVAFGLGLALYGSIFLIPLYLGTVQGYSPLQIGEVLVWVGLPQFLIFPFLPLLMKRIDQRLLVSVGCLIFAVSCFMNTVMSSNTAGDQLTIANLVRAFGQPFTIVPVTGLAIATLAPKNAASGSAIFNIFRNVGGSFGIALLSTLVTRREQFHDLRIGETVTAYAPQTQARIAALQQTFIEKGFDPVSALKQAYAVIKSIMTREAFVMAFNDAFLVVAIGLLVAAVAIWFCKNPKGEAAAVAH
ncbi:MAG TPA: DHA2 family efflux MFS transporter permease subunit [Candidatus Udaeobacter sp.]|nr:DHA2 family efflux MFS transporter permease subunit [Candidatus Udaeobacter sp.]